MLFIWKVSICNAQVNCDHINPPSIVNFWGCGSSFVTCGPGQFDIVNETFINGLVCGIIDVRNTCCFERATNMTLSNLYLNKMFALAPEWTFNNLGTVFSIAVDNRGDIFVAATTTFGSVQFPDGLTPSNSRGSGSIYKINALTGVVNTNFVTTEQYTTLNTTFPNRIPNKTLSGLWGPNPNSLFSIKTGPGLGDLTYNKYHDFVYVSNFEDGHIYKINPNSGNIIFDWDPTFGETNPSVAFDNGGVGFAVRGQRPWGLGVFKIGAEVRLYYSNWKVDARERNNPLSEFNEIWSVQLDNNGNPIGSEKLEIVIDHLNNPQINGGLPAFQYSSNPVSDISFSQNGVMLLAEKGMEYDFGYVFGMGCGSPTCNPAHQARLLQYNWNGITWQIYNYPNFYQLACSALKTNSSGGVDVGYNTCDSTKICDSIIYVTGDFNSIQTNLQVYGFAGIEFGDGNCMNHRYVDFNGQINNSLTGDPDKLEIGDVEIFKCEISCVNCCDSIKILKNNSCCSNIRSECSVDSIYITVVNGTLGTMSWSCNPSINSGAYEGQIQAAINVPNKCAFNMTVCANPIYTNPYAPIIINYHLDLANGGVCSKSDTLYCPCAVIKGEVWHDANANGLNENATENGINGLEVELVDAMSGQVVSTSITQKNPITPSDDGYYNFPCVKPGMYYVRFDSLPNYTNTLTNQGSNDQIDSDITNVYGYYTTNKITVNNGDTICDLDGGFKDTLITSTSFFVQGFAKFGETKPMPYVNTILFDKVSRVSKSTLTDLRGAYSFYDLSSASNYEIRLNFEDDYLSGVTTYDILQIQKHILGINEFSSPYKFIAADVNQTKTITAADISEIRKLILGVIPSFPKTKSWKFVNKNRMDPLYPMLSQEYADINISTLDKNNVNFEAVKMGDVNSSALFTDGAQTRTSQTLKLIGHTVIKGTTMKVSYQSLEELCVNGIQLGLTLPNGLKVNQIHFCGEKISENNYTHIVDELRISHNQMEMCTPKSNNFLLEIEFDIKTPVDEYEILQKVDFISEVYGCQNVIYPIEIIAETKANNFEITHIVPTVFSSEIEIGIFSNSSNMLQLDIYNTSGTNIYSNKFQITKSYSRNLIKDLDSVPPGVYVMHFQVGNSTKLRKIIKM